MAYEKINWQNETTETSPENFNHMENGIFGAYPVQLIAISDTAPSTCAKDDKYYNSTSKKIFTATGTNTWGSTGTTPLEDTSYWLISENGNYAWDGTNLVSIGGGKAEVIISDTEPSDGKLWIDTAEIPVIAGREHLVQVSNEVDEDYRVNLINGLNIWNEEYKIGYAWNNQSGFPSRATGFIEVKPNTKYTIVVEDISNLSGGTLIITEKPYIDATTFPSQHEISSDGSTTFTTYASCYCLAVQLTISSGNISTSNFPKIMIVEGEGTYTYEPLIKRNINVEGEKFTDTLNVGSVVDSRSRVNVLYSKNLFTNSNLTNGFLNTDGTITTNADFRVSDYINVSDMSKITISGNSGGNEKICFYNSSKTFISAVNTSTNTTMTIDVPNNSTYVRATIKATNLSIYTIQEGSSIIQPSIYVDNEEIYSKWKYLGQTTGTTKLQLPNNWKELYIMAKEGSGATYETAIIMNIGLSAYTQYCIGGRFTSGTNGSGIMANIDADNKIGLNYVYVNGSDVVSNSLMLVYWK